MRRLWLLFSASAMLFSALFAVNKICNLRKSKGHAALLALFLLALADADARASPVLADEADAGSPFDTEFNGRV